jgi:RNA polymerase sigma factor (TIGR02999 family)
MKPAEDSEWHQSVYDELYRLADRALRKEAAGHSLQPTMLVDDAYLYLLEQQNVDMTHRAKVMAVGATFLRRILVDHARRRKAEKRGGKNRNRKSLHISIADDANAIDVLELNEVMDLLAAENPRAAQVVELKFFGGMSNALVADHLSVSSRTVSTDWRFAKAWIGRHLSDLDT